jgi:hypothetical protein
MPTLHLQVCAGFANRVRALVSGICFAEDHHLELVIHWFPKSPECFCSFQHVLYPKSLPQTVKVVTEDLYNPIQVLSREDCDKQLVLWNKESDLVWKSYSIFYTNEKWETHLRNLKASWPVYEFLNRRCRNVNWSTAIGIHIRRTDNKKSIEGSPLESFLTKMRELPDAFFVVATDDLDVKQRIEQEFLGRCVFPAQVLSRRTEEGMLHGVLDFFALSKCSKILGSYWSSFSEIAASYGNIKLTVVT